MTGPAYKAAIAKLGLTINGAGRFFGVSRASAHRWIHEGTPVSVDILIRLMLALRVSPSSVNSVIGRKSSDE